MACFYVEGMGYQENILPKKHKELGLDVSIIASPYAPFQEGENNIRECGVYVNRDGVEVTILPFSKCYNSRSPYVKKLSAFMKKYSGLIKTLESMAPDIIFIHGLQELDTMDVVKYKKKHPDTKIYVDQHGDYYNMPITGFSNFMIQKFLYAMIANYLSGYTEKMWGVTPWRVQYLQEVYRIPAEKTGFLPMGGDDSLIDIEHKDTVRKRIRGKYQINETDFLVISGGKIDKTKNIDVLMQAVCEINQPHIKLLIFGKPDDEMRETIEKLSESCKNIVLAGWISSEEAYNYFLASDLGIFPGTHSVLWEQALATGLPCIFKHWKGMEHVDAGGNAILMEEPENNQRAYTNMILDHIQKLSNNDEDYLKMKYVSETKGMKIFSYREIAKRSIQL